MNNVRWIWHCVSTFALKNKNQVIYFLCRWEKIVNSYGFEKRWIRTVVEKIDKKIFRTRLREHFYLILKYTESFVDYLNMFESIKISSENCLWYLFSSDRTYTHVKCGIYHWLSLNRLRVTNYFDLWNYDIEQLDDSSRFVLHGSECLQSIRLEIWFQIQLNEQIFDTVKEWEISVRQVDLHRLYNPSNRNILEPDPM